MNILITGYTGYLGSPFLNILKKNYKNAKIFCVSSRGVKKKNKLLNYKKLDLTNYADVKKYIAKIKPKILFHFAWKINFSNYQNSLDNFISLQFSKNLYFLFCKYGGKQAYFVGSDQEYDDNSKICREKESKKKKHNYYSLSKYYLYNYINKTSKNFNSQFTWFRVFPSYGSILESPKRLIPSLIISAIKDKKILIKNPHKKINLLHVKDVARAMHLVFIKNITGIVNIASKKKIKILDIKKFIYGVTNKIKYSNVLDLPKIELKNLNKISFREKIEINQNLIKLKNIYKKKFNI